MKRLRSNRLAELSKKELLKVEGGSNIARVGPMIITKYIPGWYDPKTGKTIRDAFTLE